MKKRAGLVLMLVCRSITVLANDGTNQYSPIYQRNIFALGTPAATNSAPVSMVAVRIRLTGIVVFFPQKWALLQIQEPGKSPAPVVLKENMKASTVEVVEIDPRAKWVKILNGGEPMTLTFDNASFLSGAALPGLAEPDPNHVPVPTTPLSGAGDP